MKFSKGLTEALMDLDISKFRTFCYKNNFDIPKDEITLIAMHHKLRIDSNLSNYHKKISKNWLERHGMKYG